jgi:hypothetical protein
MTYGDAVALPNSEAVIMSIVLGQLRGGEYNFKRHKWAKEPWVL